MRQRGRTIREEHLPDDIALRCGEPRGRSQVRENLKHHQTVQAVLHKDELPVLIYDRAQREVHQFHR